MAILRELADSICAGAVEVVDLTAPLSESTPVIRLPADHGQDCAAEVQPGGLRVGRLGHEAEGADDGHGG